MIRVFERSSRYFWDDVCRFGMALMLGVLVCGCAPAQTGDTRAAWLPSPNHGPRRANFVILHHTRSISLDNALAHLIGSGTDVSAHYLIDRDGRLLQLWMKAVAPGTRVSPTGEGAIRI